MRRRFRRAVITAGAAAISVAALLACSDEGSDATADDDLTGSLASARACAIQDAYTRASVFGLPVVEPEQLPSGVVTKILERRWGGDPPESLSVLQVPAVGPVYLVEQIRSGGGDGGPGGVYVNIDFVSAAGDLLVIGTGRFDGPLAFYLRYTEGAASTGNIPLRCPSVDSGPTWWVDSGVVRDASVGWGVDSSTGWFDSGVGWPWDSGWHFDSGAF